MNLISCEWCGVVLDFDRIPEPQIFDHNTGEAILENSAWDGEEFIAKIECPVCENYICYLNGAKAGTRRS